MPVKGQKNPMCAYGHVRVFNGKRMTCRECAGNSYQKDSERRGRIPRTDWWEKIHVRTDTGCWEWTAGRYDNGYGVFIVKRKNRLAHRVVYEMFIGPIPVGLTLDHLCRNRPCCNPWHMDPCTIPENIRRGEGPSAINARKTHCIRGHEFIPGAVNKNGDRFCRECDRDKAKKRWQAVLLTRKKSLALDAQVPHQ